MRRCVHLSLFVKSSDSLFFRSMQAFRHWQTNDILVIRPHSLLSVSDALTQSDSLTRHSVNSRLWVCAQMFQLIFSNMIRWVKEQGRSPVWSRMVLLPSCFHARTLCCIPSGPWGSKIEVQSPIKSPLALCDLRLDVRTLLPLSGVNDRSKSLNENSCFIV